MSDMMSKMEQLKQILTRANVFPGLVPSLIESIDSLYSKPDLLHVVKEPAYNVVLEDGEWICREYKRKDKYSEPVYEVTKIPREDVDALLAIVLEYEVPPVPLTDNPADIKSKYKWSLCNLAQRIIAHYDLKIPVSSFLGYRSLYNKYYLYPMRVLDKMKQVRFGNCGWRLR
jgi:hypothetical protein